MITARAPVGYRPGVDLRAGVGLLTAAATAAVTIVFPDPPAAFVAPAPTSSPNIVYIVLDDLSSNLVPYMSEVGRLADEGITFDNFFVTDSQCCPSRASTLTGMYPHNSGVLTNGARLGGFDQFIKRHRDSSLGPQISEAGYRTGYIGKFLNGYRPNGSRATAGSARADYPAGFVPPGWDEWYVSANGYSQFDYTVAEAIDSDVAELVRYGNQEDDYYTDVMTRTALDFLDRAVEGNDVDQPFFLTLAPFAVHSRVRPSRIVDEPRFPAAPRDRAVLAGGEWPRRWAPRQPSSGDCGEIAGGCDAVVFPDQANPEVFNQVPTGAARWMSRKPLTDRKIAQLREMYLDRIRMAQSVNDLIRKVRAHLESLDVADSTYIVFTSDNGYHLGEHGMTRGKSTMFDSDIRVPLIVVPPGSVRPRTVDAVSQNTDLLPTFLDLAGAEATGADGRSLVPWLEGNATPSQWRDAALVEFTQGPPKGDPDRESNMDVPTYRGVRTADYVYIDYTAVNEQPGLREAEFYDLARDPGATVNRFGELSPAQRTALDRALDRYSSCAGDACTVAGRSMPDVSTRRR